MLFQSKEFLLYFLPITLIGFFLVQKLISHQVAKLFLIACSLFFYGWWKISYVPVFLLSVGTNFYLGTYLHNHPDGKYQRPILIAGIVFNLGLLFLFKYADFAIGVVNSTVATNFPMLGWMLPLGISFFTFQNIAFIVDNYEGLGEKRFFRDYLLYVAFFPHLLAGPIMHHKELLDQFKVPAKFNLKQFHLGLFIFLVGMFKKVAIADAFAKWADAGFSHHASLNLVEGWSTSLSFLIQLYFDFSGYSDMAIGLGLFFNIRFPVNFDSPLKSTSLIEFWQRWHMTLTRFINTYVYTPIVRSFSDINLTSLMLSTFIAMFLAGLWHGAGWTFVLFGAWHAFGLVGNHLWRKANIPFPKILGWAVTFVFVLAGFVMFRAGTVEMAVDIYKAMLGMHGVVLDPGIFSPLRAILGDRVSFSGGWFTNVGARDRKFIIFCLVALAIILFGKNTKQLMQDFKWSWRNAFATAFLVLATANVIYAMTSPAKFLYFNF